MEYKNKFFNSLEEIEKDKFNILFKDTSDVREWETQFREFVEKQKDNNVIDLTEVYFLENYNITKNDFIFKIFEDYGILTKEECYIEEKTKCKTNKQTDKKRNCFIINKKLNFSNAIFYKKIEFIRTNFEKEIIFEGSKFYQETNFICCEFKSEVKFEGAKFLNIVRFKNSQFKSKTKWADSVFKDYSSFEKVKFKEKSDFENIRAYEYFYFHEVGIKKLNLKGAYFDKPNFLALTNIDGYIIKKDNFENKETVRILKDIFEKENNFSESNIYFPIEQEFLIELLKKDETSFPNKILNLISLYFHKYISNFGTDWLRVLLVMMIFGFSIGISYYNMSIDNYLIKKYNVKEMIVAMNIISYIMLILYIMWCFIEKQIYKLFLVSLFLYVLQYLLLHKDISNYILQLVNPLNLFVSDIVYKDNYYIHINYFENFALFGVIVKVITIALIYQFIISFRSSTRRK